MLSVVSKNFNYILHSTFYVQIIFFNSTILFLYFLAIVDKVYRLMPYLAIGKGRGLFIHLSTVCNFRGIRLSCIILSMGKILKTSVSSLIGLGLAFSVFAQTSPTPVSTSSPQATPTRTPLRQQREEIRIMRKDVKEEMKERRQMTKEEMGNMRKEFQDKVREMRAGLKASITAKRDQLKQDLRKIRDERKKQVVERIDKQLDELNERMTNHFVNMLEKLDKALERIDERTDRAEEKSINVVSVRTAIEAAHKAITDARAAVEAQAAKTYKVAVNTEAKLKVDVGKARQALHNDLKVLREKVKMVRDAVHEAARAFAKAHGRDLPSPSPSLTVSPSPTATPTP